MAKVRAGIEIPIIPEDLEPSVDALVADIVQACLEEPDRYHCDDLHAVEWAIAESFLDPTCQS